jgi:hypothetical protein
MDWLNQLATPAIALAGIAIAYAQWRIANTRLTHDLFDRRYAVYAAAKKFIQQICQKRTLTIEELSLFLYASAGAVFVLDEELAAYLDQLRDNAVKAAELYERISAQTASQEEIRRHWDTFRWFSEQLTILTKQFKPFLQYKGPLSQRFLTYSKRLAAVRARSAGRRTIRIVGLAALSFNLLMSAGAAEKAISPPTATEIFHLRSECAALGKKILDENIVGPALYQTQISRYNPLTNRCYVELSVQCGDITKGCRHYSTTLYDGQTGEMLAFIRTENGQRSGMVFDRAHQTTTDANAGWDDARDYIDAMMADDRKQ